MLPNTRPGRAEYTRCTMASTIQLLLTSTLCVGSLVACASTDSTPKAPSSPSSGPSSIPSSNGVNQAPAPVSILGQWRVTSIKTVVEEIPAPKGEAVVIEFAPRNAKGEWLVAGNGGVNRFGGSYGFTPGEGAVGSLNFGPLLSTMMAGASDRMAFEAALLAALAASRTVTVEPKTLVIDAGDARVTMIR